MQRIYHGKTFLLKVKSRAKKLLYIYIDRQDVFTMNMCHSLKLYDGIDSPRLLYKIRSAVLMLRDDLSKINRISISIYMS